MNVVWLPEALEDVAAIEADRANWSTASADRLSAALFDRSVQIADYPQSGRMIPGFQLPRLREVLEQGFRIMYEVFPDRIEVFGVVHARRDVFGDG